MYLVLIATPNDNFEVKFAGSHSVVSPLSDGRYRAVENAALNLQILYACISHTRQDLSKSYCADSTYRVISHSESRCGSVTQWGRAVHVYWPPPLPVQGGGMTSSSRRASSRWKHTQPCCFIAVPLFNLFLFSPVRGVDLLGPSDQNRLCGNLDRLAQRIVSTSSKNS